MLRNAFGVGGAGDRGQLLRWREAIADFLQTRLRLALRADGHEPLVVRRGVDFVGWKTWWRYRLHAPHAAPCRKCPAYDARLSCRAGRSAIAHGASVTALAYFNRRRRGHG